MPLLDHFRPPWGDELPWDTMHSGWATHVAEILNTRWLPKPFIALEHTHIGPRVEIDVATFERPSHASAPPGNGGAVATATVPQTWAPPEAVCAVPLVFPDAFEVRVYAGRAGWSLVAAVELVSPGNKDRTDERQAFAAKCATYLHRGVSVVLIDVVSSRRANLHNEVLRMVGVQNEIALLPEEVYLYAAAYRPALKGDQPECQVWYQPCAVGEPLPTMPLWLTRELCVPVEFETAYTDTCRRHQVGG